MTTKRLIIRPEAQRDIWEAAHWYEAQGPGLGARFTNTLDKLMKRITAFPLQFPAVEEEVRRALLHRFPYAVYFVIADDGIVVIAVLHQRRHPDTWKQR